MNTVEYLNCQLPDRVQVLDVWEQLSFFDGKEVAQLVARVLWHRRDSPDEITSYVDVKLLNKGNWPQHELLHKIRLLTNAT